MDVESTMLPLGTKMPSFNLLGIDGEMYTNEIFDGKKGSLVMFICNHCPFVKHVNEEIVNLSNEIMGNDIGVIGINSNDSSQEKYAEDSIDKMREYADNLGYNFPYVVDEDQSVTLCNKYVILVISHTLIIKNKTLPFIRLQKFFIYKL